MGKGNFNGSGGVSNFSCGTTGSRLCPGDQPQRVKADARVHFHAPSAADPLRLSLAVSALRHKPWRRLSSLRVHRAFQPGVLERAIGKSPQPTDSNVCATQNAFRLHHLLRLVPLQRDTAAALNPHSICQ